MNRGEQSWQVQLFFRFAEKCELFFRVAEKYELFLRFAEKCADEGKERTCAGESTK